MLAWYFIVNNTSQNDNSYIVDSFEAHCYLIYNSFRSYIAGCAGKSNSHVKHFKYREITNMKIENFPPLYC